MIKAIIFDIGGVLAYDVQEHLILGENGFASIYHLDKQRVQEEADRLWERYFLTYSENYVGLEEEYWKELTASFNIPIDKDRRDALTDMFIRPVEGMQELLKDVCAKGIKLSICSNNTEFWFYRQAHKINLFQYIPLDQIILSSRIGKSKRSPGFEMFIAATTALGVPKNECLFVDDRLGSIRQANRYELPSIHFPPASPEGALYLRILFEALQIL